MQQPVDPVASQRWWAPAPAPSLPPIGARRAYAEVLFVFGSFFAVGIVGAVLLLAGRTQDVSLTGSWAIYATQSLDIVTQIGLAVAVVLLLCSRRQVTPAALGFSLPRRPDGRLAAGLVVRILAWCAFALIAGGAVNAAVQTGHLPTVSPSAPELIFGVFDSVQAGIIEELVVLAFVVVTLRQAGRPMWEITLVALVLRGSYHIYYGPGVFGILLWASLYYWIYLRFRSLPLMMACHAVWDTVGFLSQRFPGVAAVALLLVASIWIAAPILWLTERYDHRAALRRASAPQWGPGPGPSAAGSWTAGSWTPGSWTPGSWAAGPGAPAGVGAAPPVPGPPPGWFPDPAGHNRWRWWDGRRWTEHVSHHSRAG